MNLFQVIHQRWAAEPALSGLLPAARVHTGLSVDPTPPYAVLGKRGQSPQTVHHDGSGVDAVEVRVEVFDEDLERGAAVVERLKAAFDRTAFDLSGSDKVLYMRRRNESQQQQDDGLWRLAVDFECSVFLASGV